MYVDYYLSFLLVNIDGYHICRASQRMLQRYVKTTKLAIEKTPNTKFLQILKLVLQILQVKGTELLQKNAEIPYTESRRMMS